jgi:hypothetical protein
MYSFDSDPDSQRIIEVPKCQRSRVEGNVNVCSTITASRTPTENPCEGTMFVSSSLSVPGVPQCGGKWGMGKHSRRPRSIASVLPLDDLTLFDLLVNPGRLSS